MNINHFAFSLFLILAATSPFASARLGTHRKLKMVATANKPIQGQYIVQFKNDQPNALGALNGIMNANDNAKIHHIYEHVFKGAMLSNVKDQLLQRLLDSGAVEMVHEDAETLQYAVQTGAPWGLDRIDARSGLDGNYMFEVDGSGVDIYVLDTGAVVHPDYSARYKGCVDFTDEGCVVETPAAHGTHVAGSALGTTYGVAKGGSLYNYKVLRSAGSGSFGWSIAAVDDITAQKELKPSSKIVINMSLGGGKYDLMNESVDRASATGVVVVVAAGNDSSDACNYSPSSAISAITVGATDSADQIAHYSNTGACVDIFAPGSSILSADADGGSRRMSGTSMASPHVAGAAAMYLQANKDPLVDMLADATTLNSKPFLFVGDLMSQPTNPPTGPPATLPPQTCSLKQNGEACASSNECCSHKCNGPNGRKKCVGGYEEGDLAPTNPPGECGLLGEFCSVAGNCCSGKCNGKAGFRKCK